MRIKLLAAVAACAAFTLTAPAAEETFAWDHDGKNVNSFQLRIDDGDPAKPDTVAAEVGAAAREVKANLEPGKHRFYMVAVSASGLTSEPSNIVEHEVPPNGVLQFRLIKRPDGTARIEVETTKKQDVQIQKSPNGKAWQTAATFKNMHGRLVYEDLSGKSLFWRAK